MISRLTHPFRMTPPPVYRQIAGASAILVVTFLFTTSRDHRNQPQSAHHFNSKAGKAETSEPRSSPSLRATATRGQAPSKPGKFRPQADLVLPALDHPALLQSARRHEESGRFLFAVPRHTPIDPHRDGRWEVAEDQARWHFHLRSTGAVSLNLAFSDFRLPPSATLSLSRPLNRASRVVFTSKDNEEHGELWTPVFAGEEIVMTLEVPVSLASQVRLRLEKTNHGFRSLGAGRPGKSFGDATSGSCNIDVVCSAADDPNFGPLVDLYRDQIRSVAAYTLRGVEACTGALINNTRNDLTPFFLTADHCGINSSNAASVVVYWNFENSTCRIPRSNASGADGDGPVTQFNSGSIFRASDASSDFCLIELDDPVDPTFSPFFAGWDRSGANATSSVGIHHPGVSEKRISFELDPTTVTAYGSDSSSASGTHLRVGDWDFGTTEPGSSGSPLFDDSGRIIGQLHGGDAACGNDEPDWYGRFSRSWAGGAGSSSRLADWLDPDGTGRLTLDGINSEALISLGEASVIEGNSGRTTVEVLLTLSEPVNQAVSVTLRTEEDTAGQNDFVPLNERITLAPNETNRTITLSISGDSIPEEHESFLLLASDPVNAAVTSRPGRVTILNDDFVPPVIDSALTDTALANSPYEYRLTARNTPDRFSLADGPEGMSINSLTGVLSWTPPSAGTATVTVIAANPAGSDSATLTLTIEQNDLVSALDLPGGLTVTNGSPGWFSQNNTTFDSIDAAQADDLDDDGSASFSLLLSGPDVLEYDYKVSSEEDFDFLRVLLDGEEQAAYSGELDWREAQLTIPSGDHTITFRYQKDGSISTGGDTAWLDSFELASDDGRPALISPSSVSLDAGSDFSYRIESLAPTATFGVGSLPAGLSFDGAETITGQVALPGRYTFEITARLDGREDRRIVTLQVAEPVADAVDFTRLPWIREGQSIWYGQRDETYDGVDAARSGTLEDSESSSLSINITGPDRLTFHWKVSSEEDFDELAFLLDGSPFPGVEAISGEQDWTPVNVTIPSGTHLLTWRYQKDGSVSGGSDAAWLDDLRFASGLRPMVWNGARSSLITGTSSRIDLDFINAETYGFEDLPTWLSYREETEELVGIPPDAEPFSFRAFATGNGETSERLLSFQAGLPSPSLASALGQSDLIVSTNEPAAWTTTGFPPVARSAVISDDEASSMTLTLQGPGTLRFRWSVSSEASFDFLSYSLNGAQLAEISGEVPWEEREVLLPPGRSEITWTYEKDSSASDGRDWGRVADLVLGGYARFLSDEGVDPYATRPFDDPEGNGLSLLHEYAFLVSPGEADKGSPLRISRQAGEVLLAFDGLLPGGGIRYQLEATAELSSARWTLVESPFEIERGESRARYDLAYPISASGTAARFFRLRARFD